MGTIKQGVLGGFSGKVGNVVGSSWRGIAYMKSLPQNVKDARTEAQLSQRSKFSVSMAFLQPITPYLRVGFGGYTQKCTAFNAAMSYTVNYAVGGLYPNYVVDYTKALVSRGSLSMASGTSATVNVGKVVFTWSDNSGMGNAQATDVAMPMVYNTENGEVVYSMAAATRSEGTAELDTPAHWSGCLVVIYLGFATEDSKLVSNSAYLGEEICI